MSQEASQTSLNAEAERRRGLEPKPPADGRQSDATPGADGLGASTAEAIDRATAALGHDDGSRR